MEATMTTWKEAGRSVDIAKCSQKSNGFTKPIVQLSPITSRGVENLSEIMADHGYELFMVSGRDGTDLTFKKRT
jgi:hypothetical protein